MCHFTLHEASLARLNTDAISIPKIASLATLQPGVNWEFPVVELVLSQDPFQRRVGLSEALWITGLSPQCLQELMLSSAWIAAWTKSEVKRQGLTLESVQFRFALDAKGIPTLVDAFGVDDLGLEKDGERFQFESALDFYKKTTWYDSVVRAQKQALHGGSADWKKICVEPAPLLDPKVKEKVQESHAVLRECFLGSPNHVL